MQTNSFWQYSISVYSEPGVSDKLLELQDNCDVDINIVLCCCWLGEQGRTLSFSQVMSLINASALWREKCLDRLRSVRRFLKTQPLASSLYDNAKVLELGAERWQQDLLFKMVSSMELGQASGALDVVILNNLKVYTECVSTCAWVDIEPLYSALLEHF